MTYKDKMVVQTYVPIDLYNVLKDQADKERRTVSAYLRIILEDYVKEHLNNHGTNN